MIEYRRNGVLVSRWEPATRTTDTTPFYTSSTKPVNQMTNDELKAELKRRLPCCGAPPEPEG